MHHFFIVGQHPVRHGVVVRNEGVHQLVYESVRVEAELFHGEGDHILEEIGSRRLGVLFQPGRQARRNAILGRHAAQVREVHDPLGFGNGELAQGEKRLPGRGGHPVGVAPAGVQHGRGRLFGVFLGQGDELVLDLEGAQLVILAQGGDGFVHGMFPSSG